MWHRSLVVAAMGISSLLWGISPIYAQTPMPDMHTTVIPNTTDACTIQSNIHAFFGRNTLNAISYSGQATCSETTPYIRLQANLQWRPFAGVAWATEQAQPAVVRYYATSNDTGTYFDSSPGQGYWRNKINWTLVGPTGTEARGVVYSTVIYNPYASIVRGLAVHYATRATL